jgi:hypothetical protein
VNAAAVWQRASNRLVVGEPLGDLDDQAIADRCSLLGRQRRSSSSAGKLAMVA